MATLHNCAEKGQIAKTVLMPGDPLRAHFIAKTYLEGAKEFNYVRGMLGYTGTYKGKSVSVMGSGMGIPSIGIYSHELFVEFDVDNIIRVGTTGAYAGSLDLYDVILVSDSYSDSSYALQQSGFAGRVIEPSPALQEKLRLSAKNLGYPLVEGRVHSSDVFYYDTPSAQKPLWQRLRDEQGCIAVDMESFGLFHNARVTGKNAACLLTVSDIAEKNVKATTEERELRFTRMMEIALGTL